MKQKQAEKYSIAWFRLAECVAHGQKERALGMYRLLSHSIKDQVLAIQLKADLLWTFNDPMAVGLYVETAREYEKEERFQQAAAVYEHIVLIAPNNPVYDAGLLCLYDKLGLRKKVLQQLKVSLVAFLKAEDKNLLQQFLMALEAKNEALCVIAKRYLAS